MIAAKENSDRSRERERKQNVLIIARESSDINFAFHRDLDIIQRCLSNLDVQFIQEKDVIASKMSFNRNFSLHLSEMPVHYERRVDARETCDHSYSVFTSKLCTQ